MDNLARKEIIDQVPCRSSLDETRKGFKSVTEFLDHVEMGVRAFVRWMLQAYAEDEFLRFIGAKPYERTPLRKDLRNGSRPRQLETRFGLIEDLRLPPGVGRPERLTAPSWGATAGRTSGLTRSSLKCFSEGSPRARSGRSPSCSGVAM